LNFAAVAIDNANLLQQSLEKQKIEQELTIAKQVQQTILPDSEIEIEGVEIGTVYTPARFVGGDFYDIVKISNDEFFMIIGDVSSKGTPAAMLMAATMAIIRSEIQSRPEIEPAEAVSNLNNVLCAGIMRSTDMFVTLFISRFNQKQMKLTYCNAGHNFPLYWDSRKKDIRQLNRGGTFVGQFADFKYKNGECRIYPGDRLLAYTDGVTEAENTNREQYGTIRLEEAFIGASDIPPKEFCRNIKIWVDRFSEGAGDEPFDDFTIIEIAFKGG
jgi:sigma-B regulation protein RsbU (phosphoserine phosphatase)